MKAISRDRDFPARALTAFGNGLLLEVDSDTKFVSTGDGAKRAKKDASVSLRLILRLLDPLKQDLPDVTRISSVK
jgi:hypothetical protein